MFLVDGERPARQRANTPARAAEYSIRRAGALARWRAESSIRPVGALTRRIQYSARWRVDAPNTVFGARAGALARWRAGLSPSTKKHRLQTSTASLNVIYRSGVKLNYLR